MTETHKNLLANIKHQMFRNQLDVPDLAAVCGLTASGMYQLLEGAAVPKLIYIEKMAKAFKMPVSALFGEPMATDAPTLEEAFQVIKSAAELASRYPDLSRVPREILLSLSIAGPDELEAVRIAMEGTAIGKESAHRVRKTRSKDKQTPDER